MFGSEIDVLAILKTDFSAVEFSDWTGNPLFTSEKVALNLNRMLLMTKILLSKIQSARKILLSGNQPLKESELNEILLRSVEFLNVHINDRSSNATRSSFTYKIA